jgi:hypothetical protein
MLLLDLFSLRSEVGLARRMRTRNNVPGLISAFVDVMGHVVEDMVMVIRSRRYRVVQFLQKHSKKRNKE